MANKKITELQLIDELTDTCNLPVDDGIQTYRATMPQVLEYIDASSRLEIRAEADAGPTGIAGQVLAGHVADTDEFGAGTDLCHYKAKTGAPLVDEEGAYNLTDHNSVTVVGGIVGGSEGAWQFDGVNQYLSHDTLLDTVPDTAINVLGHIKLDDGQVANNMGIFSKWNVTNGSDYDGFDLFHQGTLGLLQLNYAVAGAKKQLYATTQLANGAQSNYLFYAVCWDTTNGLRLFVGDPNSGLALVASDPTATTLFADIGTNGQDFIIGARDIYGSSVDYFFDGKISQFRIIADYVMTRKDVEKAFASVVELDPAKATNQYSLRAIVKEAGEAAYTSEVKPQEVHRTVDKVWLYGAQFKSDDKVTLLGGL